MVFFNLVFAFVVYVAYKKVQHFLKWRALKKWGDAQGCGEPPVVPNVLPGGLERYKVLFTGIKGCSSSLDTPLLNESTFSFLRTGNSPNISSKHH